MDDEELEEHEQCIICANRIEYAAVTPCNHTTCHRCTFRQRALYSKKSCLICRSENEKVVFTDEIIKTYVDFSVGDFTKFDATFSIEFTKDSIYTDTLALLANRCTICPKQFDNFKQLAEHVKVDHSKMYCMICSKNKKAFVSELPLLTHKQLLKHQIDGDGDDSGFRGHPECKHCHGKRFYSIDELNVHIRDNHERCYICDQYTPKTADYYKNYDSLYSHFKRDHYVCTVPLCVEKRFVVFREELDLTAHMLKEHGGLSNGHRVVIGSNTRHFQSQLSTFESSSSRRSNIVGEQEEDHNSPEVKRKRFEERARHYLNYSSEEFTKFTSINNGFRSKRIDSREYLAAYRELFSHQSSEELSFLVKEFQEFFPESSDLYKTLVPILSELKLKHERDLFPALGNGKAFNSNSWVKGGSTGSSGHDLFPALPKPKKVAKSHVQQQAIRYTTVKKPVAPTKPKINTSQASPDYRPTYLDNLNKNSSSSSLPILGGQSQSPVTSPPASALSSRSNSRNSSSANLSKFPALEKKSTKKVIPRVNPVEVVDPSRWGVVEPSTGEIVEDDFPILDKRKQKQMKKQQRMLFTNQ